MTVISYINPHFLAPSPLKPLKSSPRYQNLPGEPLTAHSEQKTAKIGQNRPTIGQKILYEAIVGPLKAYFDQLDR